MSLMRVELKVERDITERRFDKRIKGFDGVSNGLKVVDNGTYGDYI